MKKLEGDGRSIAIGKRRNANAPWPGALLRAAVGFSYVLSLSILNHHHLCSPQRVFGHGGPRTRYCPHGVAYACRRPRSNSPGARVRVIFTRVVRSPVVLTRLCVSHSLQKADTRATIVSYGCTSEAIFTIVRS